MEIKIFNWSNFYSYENAAILEELLDKKTVPFIEMINIFFPNRASGIDTDSYLITLIQHRLIIAFINHMIAVNHDQQIPFCFFTVEYFYLWFGQMWGMYYISNIGDTKLNVYVDKILGLMIDTGDLPKEICRLPRLPKDSVLPSYYENILDYNNTSEEEIIYHGTNYSSTDPITLTYFEAINIIKEKGHPESLLKIYAKKNACVYLQVDSQDVRTSNQLRNISSIECFREANSGNAAYKTRYKGLEKLKQDTVAELFKGKVIRIKDNSLCLRHLEVQITDIESKFHLQRNIIACIQRLINGTTKTSNEFELKDILFLRDDIYKLLSEATATLLNISTPSFSKPTDVSEDTYVGLNPKIGIHLLCNHVEKSVCSKEYTSGEDGIGKTDSAKMDEEIQLNKTEPSNHESVIGDLPDKSKISKKTDGDPEVSLPEPSHLTASTIQSVENTKNTYTKQKRKRGLKHPEFYHYVESQVKNFEYSFTTYLNMMRNMGYVSVDYQSYRNSNKKDNSHNIIREVSIGRNRKNKEVIFFKINEGSQVHEILMNTIEDYFIKASKKLHRNNTEIACS